MSEMVCSVCFKTPAKTCARCKTTLYCGVECQKKDFKEHKDLCILMALFAKLFQIFSSDKNYQNLLLNHIELGGNTRGIVHVTIAGGRRDLELITNKELMLQGSAEVDLDVKILKVSELDKSVPQQVSLDATQWEIAQDYGRNYTIGSELPLTLTVPYKNSFFTRAFILELL